MTTHLHLDGNFTDEEGSEARFLLNNGIEVVEYTTKSIDPNEIVRAVFHDFNAIAFLRDYLLGKELEASAGKVWDWGAR